MARILILFAHPRFEKSRIHRSLISFLPGEPGITFHDLYEAYPDFNIDVRREQALLTTHDLIVLQHPFFWYSTPPILKQWQDLVLEHGWAYGPKGAALRGKRMLSIISTGGDASAYTRDGYNRFTIRELLVPLEQTALRCGIDYLPPYMIHGTHRLKEPDIDREVERYRELLTALHNDQFDYRKLQEYAYLNEALSQHAVGEEAP